VGVADQCHPASQLRRQIAPFREAESPSLQSGSIRYRPAPNRWQPKTESILDCIGARFIAEERNRRASVNDCAHRVPAAKNAAGLRLGSGKNGNWCIVGIISRIGRNHAAIRTVAVIGYGIGRYRYDVYGAGIGDVSVCRIICGYRDNCCPQVYSGDKAI